MASKSLASMVPRSFLPIAQANKRLIADFAERSNMVYFGYVSQRSDEHHILRGLTVSNAHIDDHYCIGTWDGYDVVFVERADSLRSGKKHVWHIMEFDLKTNVDLPHVFISSNSHGHGFHELVDVKFPSLLPLALGATATYDESFQKHFSIYTTPSHGVYVEHLITPSVAQAMATHFKGLVVEITDQALYVYSEKPHLSTELLDTMLQNGTWLANQIDENSQRL